MQAMSAALYAGCAAVYSLLACLIVRGGVPRRAGFALLGAVILTAVWAAAVAWHPAEPLVGLSGALDLARAFAWYGFMLCLFHRSLPGRRPLFAVLAWLGVLAVLAATVASGDASPAGLLRSVGLDARILFALGTLLLIENLYRNTPEDARWHVCLPAVAVGGLLLYDVFLYADAALFHRFSPTLVEGRAIVTAMVAPLLAVAAARNRSWGIAIHVSRNLVFHSATLILGGGFLIGLAAVGEVFRRFGSDWGLLAEISLIFAGLIAFGMLLTSGSARSRLRAFVVQSFYNHRYDYRREWIRCIETLSPANYASLPVRVVRAIADVVDSPGGTLLLRGAEEDVFRWAGSWNQPAGPASIAPDHPLVGEFGDGTRVVELGDATRRVSIRGSSGNYGLAVADLPGAEQQPDYWLAVPLSQGGRLIGFVLLANPRAGFKLDREVIDLLRIVGREVAIALAEQRATERMLELGALHDYGRRFAFVAHDIKNVAGQLSMLLANADCHIGNPAFQRDMLLTVRSSVERITALLVRLRTPEGAAAFFPDERVASIVMASRRTRGAPIEIESDGRPGGVVMPPAAFDAMLAHLLDNAIDASHPGEAVHVRLCHEARLTIDIVDRGPGMSLQFIRDELFRPFGSSKRDGLGIGAYEARELLRRAGGDLLVMSRPGLGTTMRILLPLIGNAATAGLPLAVPA